MKIGCLGDIVFNVSDSELKTIRDATWSGSASIATHQRHLVNVLTEFVGIDADSFEFKIRISKFLGSDPLADIKKILQYERYGTALQLTIGKTSYGKYRWLIKKHKVSFEHYDKAGNLVTADVMISLTEYTKGTEYTSRG